MTQSRSERRNESAQTGDGAADHRTRLSTESKRQREGRSSVGAFGSRTGQSDLIFLEGVLPEEAGVVLNEHSIENQTSICLDRLNSVLTTRGADLTDVMKVEIQLTDMANRDVVDDVYQSRFDGEYPPRTTVGVCSLPGGAAIQLDVITADE